MDSAKILRIYGNLKICHRIPCKISKDIGDLTNTFEAHVQSKANPNHNVYIYIYTIYIYIIYIYIYIYIIEAIVLETKYRLQILDSLLLKRPYAFVSEEEKQQSEIDNLIIRKMYCIGIR